MPAASPPHPLRQPLPALAAAALLLLAALLTGCTGFSTATPGAEYVVIAPRTPFYRFGPYQNTGPDQLLDLGTRVTLVSREYGFSRYRLPSGQVGYAATNDFGLAPPPSPAFRDLPGTRSTAVTGSQSKRPRLARAKPEPEPQMNLADIPLELPESDPPKPKPRLRADLRAQ